MGIELEHLPPMTEVRFRKGDSTGDAQMSGSAAIAMVHIIR